MISPSKQRLLAALEHIDGAEPELAVELPLRLESRANDHRANHWAPRAKRSKSHRMAAQLALAAHRADLRGCLAEHGMVVRVVRVSPGQGLDSHDNVGMACKALVDGVADLLGVRDDDKRVTFVPDQERGPWGARIETYCAMHMRRVR